MLEDASIKLSAVAASLSTVSARAMPEAMVAGQRDPAVLAEVARGKMRVQIPDLRQALPPAWSRSSEAAHWWCRSALEAQAGPVRRSN